MARCLLILVAFVCLFVCLCAASFVFENGPYADAVLLLYRKADTLWRLKRWSEFADTAAAIFAFKPPVRDTVVFLPLLFCYGLLLFRL